MDSNWTAENTPIDLQHLQSVLARLDIRLRRLMLLWERAGQDAADPYRGLYVTAETASSLLARPLGDHWGAAAALAPEEEAVFAQAEEAARRTSCELADKARAGGRRLRLDHLQAVFGLDELDMEILLLGLAPAIDLRYERVFAYLQDDITRKLPSINLALDLLAPPGLERLRLLRRFDDSAPLLRHGLLRRVGEEGTGGSPLPAGAFLCDEAVVAWLSGSYRLPAAQAAYLHLRHGEDLSTEVLPLEGKLCARLKAAVVGATQPAGQLVFQPPLVVFEGPDGLAQVAAAQWLARTAGQPMLVLDADAALQAGQPLLRALPNALRDASLLDAVVYLQLGDVLTGDGVLAPALARLLDRHAGLVIVSAREPWLWQGSERAKRILRFAFPVPAAPVRATLWCHFLATYRNDSTNTSLPEVEVVANRFALTSTQVRDAAATASDLATQAGEPLAEMHLQAAARAQLAANLQGLARKVEPRYRWSDLILPDEQLAVLHEIVSAIQYRSVVLDEWGAGHKLAASSGLAVLFAGPPGTGKTMAAEVLAGELGLDLYKVDLSAIVSKYIGETEKNMERIFSAAEHSAGILFFDEADALFGKRSDVRDAHDRYANIEVSYVLQRIETFAGIAILASNLRGNLDAAFTRRFFATVDFPQPDEVQRLRIWRTLIPPLMPREGDVDLTQLAVEHELTGGLIRNAILSAAYKAASQQQKLSMDHLQEAVRSELHRAGRIKSFGKAS